MLAGLENWCKMWKSEINTQKTQILHFRPPSVAQTNFGFCVDNKSLNIVTQYKYLGLILTEHLDLCFTAKTVAQAATRALGVLITKFKQNGEMPCATYSKLYLALVHPVLEYGAPVWAYKDYACIKAVQYRAGRFFLGVGRYTPSAGIIGDLGWQPVYYYLWTSVLREYCRLLKKHGGFQVEPYSVPICLGSC